MLGECWMKLFVLLEHTVDTTMYIYTTLYLQGTSLRLRTMRLTCAHVHPTTKGVSGLTNHERY